MLRLERVRRSVGAGGLAAALLLLPLLLAGAPGNAHAQTDAFLINYYVNTSKTFGLQSVGFGYDDQLVLTNDLPANLAAESEADTLCANLYVFDSNQEMEECCGCPITPAGRDTFSVNHDLSSNPLSRPLLTGVVHIVVTNSVTVTNPVTGDQTVACDPTDDGDTDTPFHFAPEASVRGWITHSLNPFNQGAEGEAEMEQTGEPDHDFAGGLDFGNRSLASLCTSTQNTGHDSGPRGVCAQTLCPPLTGTLDPHLQQASPNAG